MKLYDGMLDEIGAALWGKEPRIFPYRADGAWPVGKDYEVVLQGDTAFELGGGKRHSANLTCVTGNKDYVEREGVYLYGPDLNEIKGATDYVRISVVLQSDAGMRRTDTADNPGQLYNVIQDIDAMKYHMYTKGFMMRTSGQSARETVRVSRRAVKDGISFAAVGNTLIKSYKKNPLVDSVKVIFVTGGEIDFGLLEKQADQAIKIKNSLSVIQKELPTECGSCTIREICGEVEGLRELHFGKKVRDGGAENRIAVRV